MKSTFISRQKRFFIAILILSLSILFFTSQKSPTGIRIQNLSKTDSISQYGITWSFSEPVEFGTFINGDYWVVGPVEISYISTPFDGANGTMINPESGYIGQGYYSTENHYYSLVYNPSLTVKVPVIVSANSSVVSTIKRDDGTDRTRPVLLRAAVLTVLSSPPPEDSFRPALVGNNKTIYTWSQVQLSRLTSIEPVDGVPLDISFYIDNMKLPWILHVPDWQGRYFHPSENMPGDYHRDIGRFLSQASVLLMMNIPDREELLKNFLQVGIDYYGMTISGEGTSSFWAWPVIFSGIMLDDPDIYNVFTDGLERSKTSTRAYDQLYRVDSEKKSEIESDIVDQGFTWTGKTAAWRQSTFNSNCYEQEHLHPSEWSSVSDEQGCSQPLSTRETYRRINSPAYVGFGVAAAVMGRKELFPHSDLYFDYIERWMEEDLSDPSHDFYLGTYTSDAAEYGSSTSEFVDDFWNKYYW